MMRAFGWHSLLVRSALVLTSSFLLAGATTIAITIATTGERQQQAASERLEQLLDTVESTASIACFVRDGQLAEEVAQGLLKNREVRSVRIMAEGGNRDHLVLAALPANHTASSLRLQREVRSPFDAGKRVGHIEITADTEVIDAEVREEVAFVGLQTAGQLGLVAVAVVVVMLIFIVRPIKAMSDGLHHMDATRGERLAVPKNHANTEIGRLVEDINNLADDLASTLGQERSLRLAKEVEEKKYRSIFENADTGIFTSTPDGTLQSWNPAFALLTGIPANEDFHGSLNLRQLRWAEPAQLAGMAERCRRDDEGATDNLMIDLGDGRRRWLNVILNPVGEGLLQGVVHDVTGHMEAEASARRLAVTDSLTGLSNRLGLEEKLRDALTDPRVAETTGFALILADLDNFRRINEGYGLPVGDAVLMDATARLRRSVKASDTIARLTGDRFALLLRHVVGASDVGRIAERILAAIRQPFMVDGEPIPVHASLGITLAPSDSADIPTLLRNAELALDRAKAMGGNGHVFFDVALAAAAEQRRRLENDLRQAIQNGEFEVHYQPIVDLDENRLAGAEALIRWNRPGRGMAPPDTFIPLAEEVGLIDEIGLWVLDQACAKLASWQDAGFRRYLSVNVSGRQIPDGLPAALVAETARRHGVEPGRLALEITEGILLADANKARAWVEAVRGQGFRVFLDDFGTGYSSLSYLKRFPVDTLKVDKSFVRDMDKDSSDRALIEAVIAMANGLGMRVIAEGVEGAAQLDLLRAMRCRYGQGYHFSRPVPGDHFEAVASGIEASLANVAKSS